MEAWKKWVIVVAGLVAAVNHWVDPKYWLDVVGGVVAAVVGLMSD